MRWDTFQFWLLHENIRQAHTGIPNTSIGNNWQQVYNKSGKKRDEWLTVCRDGKRNES